MKDFLTSTKGKIIAGAVTSGIISAIVAVIIVMNIGYRVIAVQAMNGFTHIVNKGRENDAYVGLHLKDGDDVTVSDTGDLTLSLDTDKYVYAEPSTHFWIEAKGKKNDTRTTVHLAEGSQLFRIDNKLNDGEYFEVETPNSTMSVRGTVFRVTCTYDENGELITILEVFEGEVYTEAVYETGEKTGDYRIVNADGCTKIHSNPNISEFVEDEEGNDILNIDYPSIPQDSAKFLGHAIDGGRNICIGKELLYDYVRLQDHRFDDKKIVKAPTCDEEGYYYPVCTVCNIIKKERIALPKLKHKVVEEEVPETEDTPAHIIKRCSDCGEIIPDDEEDAEVSENSASNKTASSSADSSSSKSKSSSGKSSSSSKNQTTSSSSKTTSSSSKPSTNRTSSSSSTVRPSSGTANTSPGRSSSSASSSSSRTGSSSSASSSSTSSSSSSSSSTSTSSSSSSSSSTTNPCANGHKYKEDTSKRVEPTCTKNGSKVEVCTRCNTRRTSTISKLNHNGTKATSYKSNNNGTHQKITTCNLCGNQIASVKESCTYTTNGTKQTCRHCNYVKPVVPAGKITYLKEGRNINEKIKELYEEGADIHTEDRNITAIKMSATEPSDKTHNIALSGEMPVYIWKDGSIVYWWSEAQKIYMTDASRMFYDLLIVTNLDDCITNWDTSMVTNMECMFYECMALESVDVSKIDTSNVENMSGMFGNCEKLTNLNLSGFDTSHVTNMMGLFDGCKSLKRLNISGWNTGNVVMMNSLFYNCAELTSLDVSHFDTRKVEYMSRMFSGCSSLVNINISNFDTSNVAYMLGMFGDCNLLEVLDLSNFDTRKVTHMWGMFYGSGKLKTIYVSDKFVVTALSGDSYGASMFEGCTSLVGGDGTVYNSSHEGKEYARIDDRTNGSPGYFTLKGSGVPIPGTTTQLQTGKEVNVAIKQLYAAGAEYDTEDTNITAIKKSPATEPPDKTHNIALSGERPVYIWNVGSTVYWWTDAEIVYMNSDSSYTFAFLTEVTDLDDCTTNWNTSKVNNMFGMFLACNSITSIDVSKFNTENVTDLGGLFGRCYNLSSLDVTGFDTKNVTNMYSMFLYCSKLASIDVSKFDTSNVTAMGWMFYFCEELSSLDLSNFNTENVTSMDFMFAYCKNLTSLKITSFNTEKVTSMHSMFENCEKIRELDLSSFDTGRVKSMWEMFNYCTLLERIYVTDRFVITALEIAMPNEYYMFDYCPNLVGGAGTTNVDNSHTLYTYAIIDGTNGNPGYFTRK